MWGKEGKDNYFLSKSKTLTVFCFCFILGVGFFTRLDFFEFNFFIPIFIFLIFLFSLFYKNKKVIFFIIIILSFILSGYKVHKVNALFRQSQTTTVFDKNTNFSGMVSEEEKTGEDKNQLVLSNVFVGNKKFFGKILLFLLPNQEYSYGDILSLKCRIVRPKNNGDSFNYVKYLFNKKIVGLCYYPQNISKKKVAIDFYYYIFLFKRKIEEKINLLLPDPEAPLLSGILYGARSGLPVDLTEDFKRTGLSHIIAVSGYNVQIIIVLIFSLGVNLKINRRNLFWFSMIFLLFFVIFTGAEASVVRAGIMAFAVLWSKLIGRPSNGNILWLTAGIMLFYNPYYLWYDPGFYLSFISAGALMFFYPILSFFIKSKAPIFFDKNIIFFTEIFLTSLSAYLLTAPIMLFSFGQISAVALLSNLAVLWIIPFIMFFGFVVILSGFISWSIASLVANIATALLGYVIFITRKLSSFSWSSFQFNFSLPGLFLVYVIILSLSFYYFKKHEEDIVSGSY